MLGYSFTLILIVCSFCYLIMFSIKGLVSSSRNPFPLIGLAISAVGICYVLVKYFIAWAALL